MAQKKTVFLTGASGNMGWEGFKQLYAKKNEFNIVVLLRDSEKNRKKFSAYVNDPSVKIVWGDLKNYDSVLECVTGSDFVLHVGGMVSPAADYYPINTIKTNVSAAKNIVAAVKAQPNPDAVKVVYIGTVAETGERDDPIHWARTGDPIKISVYDHYATSKVIAESIFAESGLKYWVSLRQSGILYADILKNMEPIMYHVPINGVLEWATVEDSGRLLVNVCGDDVPEEFWRRFYNIGSGKEYRITNMEFEELLLGTLGLGDPKKLFNPDWFTLRNFHGQWYLDSDVLESYLHFRANVPIKQYFKSMMQKVEFYYKLAFLAKPFAFAVKPFMKKIAQTPVYGTLWWRENKVATRINAYYGSMEKWDAIGSDWKKVKIYRPEDDPTKVRILDHGYDETKDFDSLTLDDLKKAAAFRGGECLADEIVDMYTPVKWKCAHGHEFMMSPNLVLRGGHWCPEELPSSEAKAAEKKFRWAYDEEAKVNPFFAQVWYPLHDKSENNVYTEEIYKDFKEYSK